MDWQFVFTTINSIFTTVNIIAIVVTLIILMKQTGLSRKKTNILQKQMEAALSQTVILQKQMEVTMSQTVMLQKQTEAAMSQTIILQDQTKVAIDASCSLSLNQAWEMIFKIDDIFLEKPYLRKYFYDGVFLGKNEILYAEAESAAEKLLDTIEHLLWQKDLFPSLYKHDQKDADSIWDAIERYFDDLLESSTLLRNFAYESRHWYTYRITERVERARRKIDLVGSC